MAGLTTIQLEHLFTKSVYSDFMITCRGHEWKVHKSILCVASEFFRPLCEQDFKEKAEASVEMVDDDPAAVGTLLKYLYTGLYQIEDASKLSDCATHDAGVPTTAVASTTSSESPQLEDKPLPKTDIPELTSHFLVYQLADKLNITALKNKAYEHFDELLHASDTNLRGGPALMTLVYEGTRHNDALRLLFTRFCIQYDFWVRENEELLAIIQKHDYLAWEVGSALQGRVNDMNTAHHKTKDEVRRLKSKVKELEQEITTLQPPSSPFAPRPSCFGYPA